MKSVSQKNKTEKAAQKKHKQGIKLEIKIKPQGVCSVYSICVHVCVCASSCVCLYVCLFVYLSVCTSIL